LKIKDIFLNNYTSKSPVPDIIRPLAIGLIAIYGLLLSTNIEANIEQQRILFQDASLALNTNQISKYKRLLSRLGDYPVKAYLEYDALRRRLYLASESEVSEFLKNHQDYPFN